MRGATEQRVAEAELVKWLALLPDPAVVTDRSGAIMRLNRRASILLRLSPEATTAAPEEWLAGPSVEVLAAWLSGAERRALEAVCELELRSSDGHKSRWADAAVAVFESEEGELHLLTLREKTQAKQVETARAFDQRLLRDAVNTRQIGIYSHDHVTDEIYGNSDVRHQYGLSETEHLSIEVFANATHRDDAEFLVSEIAKAHDPDGAGDFDVKHRILTPAGETRWLHTVAQTYFTDAPDGTRRPVRTIGSCIDITDTHATEEAIRRLAAIMDATPDIVAITDLQGTLTYLNRSGREYAGMGEGETLVGRALVELIPAPLRPQVETRMIPAAIAHGIWRGESELLCRSGATAPVSLVLLAHPQTRSAGAYLSMIARDLSHERDLEAQLQHSQRLEAVGRLAGGVAHDFNNMLSVIIGFATLAARNSQVPEGARKQLNETIKAAERAADLTAQLLSFSRKQVLRPKVLDVNEVLASTQNMVARLVGEAIEVALFLPRERTHIKADRSQVEQVIVNLVVNARDAMPNGGHLTIEAENIRVDAAFAERHLELDPGPHVQIAVSDTGAGMDKQTVARIFEPFFTTKEAGQGTGLGLSTVFGIVKQSGGSIWACSEPGHGTTFKIYFPTTEEPADAASPSAPVAPVAEGDVVLIVEDEAPLRRMLTSALKSAGYAPIAASGPVEALAIVRGFEGKISLLLTDVVMPQMSGKMLADTLAAEGSTIPVLFMSGYAEDAIVHHGVLDEGVHLLAKPITPDRLVEMVGQVATENRRDSELARSLKA